MRAVISSPVFGTAFIDLGPCRPVLPPGEISEGEEALYGDAGRAVAILVSAAKLTGHAGSSYSLNISIQVEGES